MTESEPYEEIGPFSGHVLRPTRNVYEAFKAELTDLQPAVETPGRSGDESVIGTHPVYGLCSAVRTMQTAARPDRPSYLIIIMNPSDDLLAQAKRDLDLDDAP